MILSEFMNQEKQTDTFRKWTSEMVKIKMNTPEAADLFYSTLVW